MAIKFKDRLIVCLGRYGWSFWQPKKDVSDQNLKMVSG